MVGISNEVLFYIGGPAKEIFGYFHFTRKYCCKIELDYPVSFMFISNKNS